MSEIRPLVNTGGKIKELAKTNILASSALGSGIATNEKFLRGDGQWEIPVSNNQNIDGGGPASVYDSTILTLDGGDVNGN